ncbi:hypothetical protein QUA07_28180 [Microcoleus sp. T3_A4]
MLWWHSGRSLDLVEFEMERAIVSLDRAKNIIIHRPITKEAF